MRADRAGSRRRDTGRAVATALLIVLGLGAGSAAFGQSSSKIPIERDLRRDVDRRGHETRSMGGASEPLQSDPAGVAGFSGPPGIPGDSVGSYSPLPPGAPGNEE